MEDNFLNMCIKQLTDKVIKEKNDILIQRINERVPKEFFPIDLEKEVKRIFPRIACIKSFDMVTENWYWNDGTENAIHLVSFIKDDSTPSLSQTNDSYNWNVKFHIK